MEIKTKRVIQRSTGREITINDCDFDAITYDEVVDKMILVGERATGEVVEIPERQYDPLKHVKVIRVREKSSGTEILVDVNEFNPDLHEEFTAEPQGEKRVLLFERNTSDATDIIRGVDTIEELSSLEAEELENPKSAGGRKGVLSEIAKRRETLSAGA